MKTSTVSVSAAIFICLLAFASSSNADKAPYSKERLEKVATDIVVGKVEAIYSRSERDGDYHYLRKIAEVRIERREKGKGANGLIYVRYFDRHWEGEGGAPTGGGSYEPQPEKGGTYRFYLARNDHDGWLGTDDGGYNVVSVNGVQPIEQAATLQGTWQGVEVWDAGKKRTAEPAKLLRITFRDDQFVVRYDGEEMLSGRFTFDAGKAPKQLTLEATTRDGESTIIPAIYKIEGHEFTLCHPNEKGGQRPSTFMAKNDVVLAILSSKSS